MESACIYTGRIYQRSENMGKAILKHGASKILFVLVFVIPVFILYTIFTILPLLNSIRLSFYNWSGLTTTMDFVGIKNYLQILKDPIFHRAFKNDFIIVFGKEIIIITLSLFFAVALTRFKFKKGETWFYRFVFYFPNILSVIVIANLWSFIYHPNIGILNSALKAVGVKNLTRIWLVENGTLLPSLIVVASWAGVGFFMLVNIAAINSISEEIYESAEIDGASQWHQLIYITIPMIWQQIKFSMITILFTTLANNFILVQPMTNGGPDNASQVMGLYIYSSGIGGSRVSYSYASAVILLVISVTISLIMNRVLYKEDNN
jgi:ABC-type sugar transport system permease subunit